MVRVLNPLIRTFTKWITVNDDLVDSTREEQIELNALVNAITNASEGSKLRLDLVNKLNKEYPGYVKMLGEEGTTNDNLKTKLEEVNKQYKIKIGRLMIEAALQKEDSKLKEAGVALLEKQLEIERLRIEKQRYAEGVQNATVKTQEELAQAAIFYGNAENLVTQEISAATEEQEKLNEELKTAEEDYNFANAALQNYIKTLGLGDIDVTTGGGGGGEPGGGPPTGGARTPTGESMEAMQAIRTTEILIGENEKKLAAEESYLNWKAEINEEINDQILEQEKQTHEERLAMIQGQLQAASFAANSLTNLVRDNSNNRIQILTNEHQQDLQNLDDLLNQNIITQEQYNERKSQLEQKHNEEILKHKKKAAQAEKKNAIFQIIINTATAVMKGFAQLGPVAGLIMKAFTIAMGLAQIATVASAPLPFGKGGSGKVTGEGLKIDSGEHKGKLIGGRSHSQGGTPLTIEAERGEYASVIKRSSTLKYRSLLPEVIESLNDGTFESKFQAPNVYETVNSQLDPYNKKIYETLNKGKQSVSIVNGRQIIRKGNRIINISCQ